MSYPTDTVLVRDEPKFDEDDKPSPFNRVRVVGPSPIRTSAVDAEWGGGQQSDLLIVQPIGNDDLVSAEIVPLAALNREFSVEYEPEAAPTHLETPRPARPVRQLAPEEQFRNAAKAQEDEKPARQRTPITS